MKKIIHTFLALLLSVIIYAQTPQSFKYQAIARDGSGQVLDNKDVSFQISILEGSTTGNSVYTETFTATTNQFGLVNLNIGTGNSNDDFTAINWSNTKFFVQIMMDQTGQSDYQLMGTSQMLSVPYALHAKTAENTFSGDYNDLSNSPDLSSYDTDVSNDFNGDFNNLTNTPDLSNYITDETDPVYIAWDKSAGISITESQISDFGNYESTFTKNSAFNKNFGNVAETVTEGNDSRLSDARTPTSHAASHINGTDDIQDASSSQKGLMTATYATKLDGIATGAEVNVATNLAIGTKTGTTLDINSNTGTNVSIPAANTTDAGLMTNAQFDKLDGIETNADVTDATNVDAAGAVMESDFNASTFLYATSDNTPQAKNISETKTILSLENVENTALSTWEGSGNVASLGTVTSGTIGTGAALADVTMSLGSDADGDIYYRSGNKLTRLAKGADNQVLTLESGVPAWKDAASGGGALAIGDFYGGGIIFWLDASGNHGLVCAKEDQSTGIQWYEDLTLTTATLNAIYGGEANTNTIVSNAGASNAAQLCDEYSVTINNEYYDNWYLPSHYELVLMYNNKATINTTITSNSGSVLTGDTYWSSTEFPWDKAGTVFFENGGESSVTKTATSISVRAIRAF
ncbi:MAG: DUF1566 domain-containing protein [Bacteroidales bacterium]|nr:DUF1566 domain-containing protein [Bacteroidales bacterium]